MYRLHRLHRLIALLSFVLLGLSAPCSRAESAAAALPQAPIQAQTETKAVVPIPNRGTLFRVARDGHVGYLFGTIHVGQASFYPLEPVVMRALAESSRLAVELDIRDQPPLKAAVEKYGMLTPPQTLEQVVTPETWQMLQQTLARLDIPAQAITRMKPWTVSNVLLALTLEKEGFVRDQGVEAVLLAQAGMLAKSVVSLETADGQIGLFDQLDAAGQEQLLRETLQSIKSGKLARDARAMMEAWGSADSATLQKLLEQELTAPTVTADFTRRILLEGRNPALSAAIGKLIDDNGSTFVAIGLLHLLGRASVPALLEKAGYQVERLY